jgi:hypothetical protein
LSKSTILVSGEKRDPGAHQSRAASDVVWSVFTTVGAALTLIGLLDLGLTWVPFRFGAPEWEFGTVTNSLNALPVVTMGCALLLAGALANGRRWLARGVAGLLVVLAVWVVAVALLYATNLPFILQAAGDPAYAEGLRKSMLKSGVQVVLFSTVFVLLATYGWRHSGRHR